MSNHTNPTCTVVVGSDGRTCGLPAVQSFVSSRGEDFHECDGHAMPLPATTGLAVGSIVELDHVGVTKRGEVERLTAAYAWVRVLTYGGESSKVVKRRREELRQLR